MRSAIMKVLDLLNVDIFGVQDEPLRRSANMGSQWRRIKQQSLEACKQSHSCVDTSRVSIYKDLLLEFIILCTV